MNGVTTIRRRFLGSLSAAAATLGAKLLASTQANPGGLPTRLLGRTGERVPILCLGGWHIGALEDGNEAIRIMHSAIDQGLTFLTIAGIIRMVTARSSWVVLWHRKADAGRSF